MLTFSGQELIISHYKNLHVASRGNAQTVFAVTDDGGHYFLYKTRGHFRGYRFIPYLHFYPKIGCFYRKPVRWVEKRNPTQ
jgi:hypothetical protein